MGGAGAAAAAVSAISAGTVMFVGASYSHVPPLHTQLLLLLLLLLLVGGGQLGEL